MENDVFKYLDEKFRYLNNYIRKFNEELFVTPQAALINGRKYTEHLTKEVANLEGYGLLNDLSQFERLNKLDSEGILNDNILGLFHKIRKDTNIAAHGDLEGDLEVALGVHKNIYKITCWFIEVYLDHKFEAVQYKSPMPLVGNASSIDPQTIEEIIKKTMESLIDKKPDYEIEYQNESEIVKDVTATKNDEHIEEAFTDLLLESIFDYDEPDKKCLIQELSRLKESSKEAVEGLGEFTPFKKYMHIVRDVQNELKEIIIESNKSEKAKLILVCGSVGDGKSHIISYFKNSMPDVMKNFILHNDATESLEPNKTSMDTLNDVLDEFSDEKIDSSTKKFILAINLGTLNNFIDSQYGERFTKLKRYVQANKILEINIEDSIYDENSYFQYVDFSDYHTFTLKNGKACSDYVKSIIQKVTNSFKIESNERNYFYISYQRNCEKCDNKNCCPIKANYEFLSKENVQDSFVDLLVQCIVKKKIIISTRALLNFIYEVIVPISYIDVNSPTFKNKIAALNNKEYINSLMPNIIFNHKELSYIFEALSSIDPLNIRNEQIDDFIIDFNNATNVMEYYKKYIDYTEDYIYRLEDIDFEETEDKKLRYELLKLFIRSYYICGKEDIFSLRDDVYDEYMSALFYWNKGDKVKLKNIYNNVKDGILKWNGEAEKDHINIFMGKNQTKYKVSEKIQLNADTSNLTVIDKSELKKFIGNLILQFKDENGKNSYEIDIDYNLYKLLVQVNNGYRPNKKDKNHYIKFIEFISKLEDTGSQNKEIIFTEKNQEINNKYKLEFDEEFETYKFVEM